MQKLPNANELFGPILLWEYLCMKSDDDPEARIRELEQPLTDAARASEIGNPPPGKWAAPPAPAFPPPAQPYGGATPPPPAQPYDGATPPPPPPYGGAPPPLPYSGSFGSTSSFGTGSRSQVWWILAAVFVIGMIALPAAILFFTTRTISHSGITTLLPNPTVAPTVVAPSGGVTAAPAPAPGVVPSNPPTAAPTAPAGASLSISGINETRTIACNNSIISVSGVQNTVIITGHCASLSVSGVQNKVTVEAVDSIEASGFTNQITYHKGSPSIDKSGDGNVVQQG
jgi:hypothetical protein